MSQRFNLIRHEDVSNVSGTGIVAEGVRFVDGSVALRWLENSVPKVHRERGVRPTMVMHESVRSVEALHGHAGKTTIEWIDTVRVIADIESMKHEPHGTLIMDAEGHEYYILWPEGYLRIMQKGDEGVLRDPSTVVFPATVVEQA